MAFDGLCLHFLIEELKESLLDTKIEKIHQPARDEFLFVLKGSGQRGGRLYLCTNASCARICLTDREIVNPKEPPGFCMLLRKKLRSARLIDIRQAGLDRIVILEFEGRNEMGDLVVFRLIAELMGRHSNLILTDETGMIIDSAKHVDALMSAKRQILPHLEYLLPPTGKKYDLRENAPEFLADLILKEENKSLQKAILSVLDGFSPVVARELALFVDPEETGLSEVPDAKERLVFYLTHITDRLKNADATPCLFAEAGGIPKELSFLPLKQFAGAYEKKEYESFSALLEAFYAEKSLAERIRQRAGDLLQWVQSAISRTEKKLSLQQMELLACKDREENRISGDLISANLYRMQKGEALLEAEDFYNENQMRRIKLDPLLTPAQNAQAYYKKYKKAATAEKTLAVQIEKGEEELDYLFSVQESLLRAESEDELSEIRQELSDAGYFKKRAKGAKTTATKPLTFRSSDGFLICVGRNNLQNDKLTLKTAAKEDIWFHTKGIHGAHTVLFTEGKIVPERSLQEAAILAAYHSKGKHSSSVPVDYCPIREVKKPSGAKPGKVIYEHYKTLYVTPDAEAIQRLKD